MYYLLQRLVLTWHWLGNTSLLFKGACLFVIDRNLPVKVSYISCTVQLSENFISDKLATKSSFVVIKAYDTRNVSGACHHKTMLAVLCNGNQKILV